MLDEHSAEAGNASAMKEAYAARIEALRNRLGSCDSAMITNLNNVRYLSGFTGSAGMLFVTPRRVHLAVDFRYVEQAARQTPFEITRREGSLENTIGDYLDGASHCAIEASNVTMQMWSKLEPDCRKLGVSLTPLAELVEGIRVVKNEREIELLRNATALLERLMRRTIEAVRIGRSELEVAVEYEAAARLETGRPLPFEPIIASGPRSALPHGVATGRLIASGEFVKIDIGLELDGYVADMTRTVAVGRADDRMREVHAAVAAANEAAVRNIRPGISGEAAHRIAENILSSAGLASCFGHGLGHGVGIEVHERPRLSPTAKEVLTEGMVFTIEPGVYLPGWGGVRIEDMGVLRAGGVEIFNRMPRELEVV